MNYLNAFASVNKMNTNEILAQRFYRFFKFILDLLWMFNGFYCRSNAISFVVCSFKVL